MICTLLLMNKTIDQYVFRDLIIATVAAYIAGRTYEVVKENEGDTSNG